MKYIAIIILFLFLSLFLAAEDATKGINYSIKPLLKQDGSAYFLSVSGTTNLPDKALLDITFTYRFPGGDNERYLDYKRCLVTASAYQAQLGPLRRKPPAGEYLFKVTFDPDRQSDEVRKYLSSEGGSASGGESKYQVVENLSKTEVLAIGASAEDAPKERRQMMAIIQKEGLTLKAVSDDIKGHYSKYQETLRAAEPQRSPDNFGEDIKALRQWSADIIGKLESLVKAILLEDELRVFESVTQAKASIENSAFLLKSLLKKQDEMLVLKEQPVKDAAEFNRKLAVITEEIDGLYKLTDREVTKNLRELGIFSLNKDALLGSLGKIEAIINQASENEPLKDAGKSVIMQEVVALSQNLPEMFYDDMHKLVSEIIGLMKGNDPIAKQAKDGIILRIKTLRSEIEGK
ncbi:MAG: hypothetical protein HZA49_09810 [Planctomycetes bacterium]|nr:hypothetical protein [Planctomycetota bacterium]